MQSAERHEIFTLLWDLFEKRLEPMAAERLESLISSNLEARRIYVEFFSVTASIRWRQSLDHRELALARITAVPLRTPVRTWRLPIGPRWAAAVLCGVLVAYFAGLVVYLSFRDRIHGSTVATHSGVSPTAEIVATVTRTEGCVWKTEDSQKVLAQGSQLHLGEFISLSDGIAELTLSDGARVMIEGPSQFELVSSNGGFLRAGKLIAHVPMQAKGFAISTPTAKVIDLGTEFGVEVADSGSTEVHVHRGKVQVKKISALGDSLEGVTVTTGRAVHVDAGKQPTMQIRYDASRFAGKSALAASPTSRTTDLKFSGPIWLGNLFDDPRGTPLGKAMETDEFRAVAEIDDLGVDRALYFGDPVKQIAPNIRFDFTNLGWVGQPQRVIGAATNDSWSDSDHDNTYPTFTLRTLGSRVSSVKSKIEEGLGTHTNSLVTFDLDELRAAGAWQGRTLQYVCDRAGINDDIYGDARASVHMVVLVCNDRRVLTAAINGAGVSVAAQKEVWSVTGKVGTPLRADGRFVAFRISIPVAAKYFTLVASAAGDSDACDHAVWSGARIEIAPSPGADK